MSKAVRVKLKLKGITELKRQEGVQRLLDEYGMRAEQGLGDGYASMVWNGRKTSGVVVYPATKEAGLDNYRNNTILKGCGWF